MIIFAAQTDGVAGAMTETHNSLIGLWVTGGVVLLLIWFVSSLFWARAPKGSAKRSVLLMVSLIAASSFVLGLIFALPSLRL